MMTEIKNEPLGSNSSNSSKAGTKNYKLWGKYKNNHFNVQESDQKKAETVQGFEPWRKGTERGEIPIYKALPVHKTPGG